MEEKGRNESPADVVENDSEAVDRIWKPDVKFESSLNWEDGLSLSLSWDARPPKKQDDELLQ